MFSGLKKPSLSPKTIGLILGLLTGVTVSLLPPPAGLTPGAMTVSGIFLSAIVLWIFSVFPMYITSFLMCALWTATGAVDFTVAFGTFSTKTWWTVIGALGIGLAVHKSGLLRRVALLIMKIFPKGYRGQILAMLCTGTMISPMIPSSVAKMSIASPMSMSIGETMGLKKRSRPLAGLYCATYIGYALTCPAFISASFISYIILGILPSTVAAEFDWIKWFVSMLPWLAVLVVGSYFFISRFYAPEEELAVSGKFIQEQLAGLGRMSGKEIKALGILAAAIVLWMTESFHGIPSAIVSMVILCCYTMSGLLSEQEFCHDMNWGIIFFVGGVASASSVFSAVGIDAWLVSVIGPYFSILSYNIYLLIFTFVSGIYLIRFILAEMTTAMILFTVLLAPVAVAAGINPWIIGIICYTSVYTWNTFYQNSNYLVAYVAAGGEEQIDYRQTFPASVAYMALNLIGLLVSVPFWTLLGYIH